jgi:hypothetical protein
MKEYLRNLWCNIFGHNSREMKEKIILDGKEILGTLDLLKTSNDDLVKIVSRDLVFRRRMNVLMESLPDMVWSKCAETGVYLEANPSIIEGLFCGLNPIGKNDVELAKELKSMYGDRNHTFGEVCGNSDVEVAKTGKPQRFYEYGKIKGRMMYLEVYKAPIFDETGKLVEVCGSGRDLTPYVEKEKSNGCHTYCGIKESIFTLFEYKNKEES